MPAPVTGASTTGPSTDGLQFPPQTRRNDKTRSEAKAASRTILLPDESAALRDRLLSEIAGLPSQDSAATWAGEALPAKNTLTAGDAMLVEDAFEQKLSQLSASPVETVEPPIIEALPASVEGSQGVDAGSTANQLQPKGIDKSVLAVSTPRRYRNKEHLRYVTLQPCLVCARKRSDAHHLRFVQPRALGCKTSDEFAVPLCRIHHRAAHRAGDERAWWKAAGIDPLKIARKLWKDTRGNTGQGRPNLNGHVLAYDNLSGLPSWLSDALCRLASGGSFAIRRLYTDCDEVLFQAARPAVLNGIEDVVSRSDLADRAIFLALEPIADERRRTERQLWREFEVVRPRILGALLDAAAHGLRRLPQVRLERSPRMADFALWATACETAFWGRVVPFCASMMPTVGPRSKASLRPTPWPLLCGKSWPCAAHGQEGPPIFCAPLPQVKVRWTQPQDGREIRAPWPAGCVAARRSSGPSALILPLVAKAERAAG